MQTNIVNEFMLKTHVSKRLKYDQVHIHFNIDT